VEKHDPNHENADFVREVNKAFYETEAEAYDARHPEVLHGARDFWERKLVPCIMGGAVSGKGRRILDLGCGTGMVGDVLLGSLGAADMLVCCDLSAAMLACARCKLAGRSKARVRFAVTDAVRGPFRSASFDVITCNALLHHLGDYAALCAEADRLLCNGGYLVVAQEPNRAFFQSPAVRIVAFVYKLMGLGKSINSNMREKINRNLRQGTTAVRNMSAAEILRTVEYNSPVEQSRLGVSAEKGFVPEELARTHFPQYNIILLETYTTAFVRPVFERIGWLGRLARASTTLLRGKGNHFCLVLEKPR
jgi:ubiquinone/menaquinone biosynthesis C-methylase UbiE